MQTNNATPYICNVLMPYRGVKGTLKPSFLPILPQRINHNPGSASE